MPGLTIYYTFDRTDPDNFYPAYSGVPLGIPKLKKDLGQKNNQ
ncbi:hypothetical protein EFY79_07395 [Hanamia caeni]|jgi:hexosaminidase|uniref:Uncharacterized protein n=1 Tax=Hanamia caeni TaxID=2294116 RepID=A0A3M9NK12_9BACT|nr:hypothetical protein [Hanamia caeni]RNI38041.1 hypothetical protein EFY79_07395 [Hanamia caeni]